MMIVSILMIIIISTSFCKIHQLNLIKDKNSLSCQTLIKYAQNLTLYLKTVTKLKRKRQIISLPNTTQN